MKKVYIENLTSEKETVKDIFLLHSIKSLEGKKGNYIEAVISDRTGSVRAFIFENSLRNKEISEIKEGIYELEIETGEFKKEKRVIVKEIIREVEITEEIKKEIVPGSPYTKEFLKKGILERIEKVKNPHLNKLLKRIFRGIFFEKFLNVPAAKKYHHAYIGGLAEHTINVCDICVALGSIYRDIDMDLLLSGALLHDIGKVESYKIELFPEMEDVGKLLDHIYIGMKKVDDEIEKLNKEKENIFASPFPNDLRLKLLHLIASHHGTRAQGALAEPLTREALLLYYADIIDADMFKYIEAIETAEQGERWTPYNTKIRKSLFIGGDEENDKKDIK